MTSTTLVTSSTLLILLSVVSSTAASSPLPSATSIAPARVTNDEGACHQSELTLVNQLRGGGPKFWKNNNAGDEYEYYEEYYDEYDDEEYNDDNAAAAAGKKDQDDDYLDEYEDYYELEEVDDRGRNAAYEEEEDDYSDVIGTAKNNHNAKKQQRRGGSKLFGFGGSGKRSTKNKSGIKMSTTRASRASFIPSFRAPSSPHYSTRGGGHSLSGTSAAITALLSRTTSVLSDYMSTLSSFVMSLLQPLCSSLSSMACYAYSTLCHWIVLSIQLLRDVIDMVWYGPAIDGITTTGVMSRYGGLQSILFGSTLSTVVTAFVGVGLISWMVAAVSKSSSFDEVHTNSSSGRLFRPWALLRFGRRSNIIDDEEEDDVDANPHYSLEPPTLNEEMEFISRTFKSANPSSKQRISETIAMSNQGLFHRLANRRGKKQSGSKSPRRQRKMTVKSIQKWWKRDPNMVNGGQPINIVKPRHSSYSSKSKNPSINQLQNQLQKSEAERYQLQNDIQKLQLRLQKAHSDARNIASQNKWLEKQTSRADQILNRAVEVERKKANEEVERVRGEMKGVLERERLMMRGNSHNGVGIGGGRSMLGGGNDIDLNRGPTSRVMDGVKIVRDVDDYDDDDMLDERGRPPWRAM